MSAQSQSKVIGICHRSCGTKGPENIFPIFMSPGNPLPIAEDALGVGEAADMLPLIGSRAEAACGESQVLCTVDAPFGPRVLLARLPLSDKKPYALH